MKVIDYKKVNINKIIYKEPIKTIGGCLLSQTYYSYNDEEIPIYIQTPRLKNTSNLVVNDSKAYLELELDKKHINFYEFINNIDDQNITKTHNRSEDWFDEKLPMDVIDDFYKTNIKMRKYNKAPIIKFKIPLYKNKKRKGCDIFGDDLQPIDISEIKKDMEVICILELQGIKFFKQRFETEWRVVQLRAYIHKNIVPRECLINEDFLSDIEDSEQEEGIKMLIEENNNSEDIKSIEIDTKPKLENHIKEIIKIEEPETEKQELFTEEIINDEPNYTKSHIEEEVVNLEEENNVEEEVVNLEEENNVEEEVVNLEEENNVEEEVVNLGEENNVEEDNNNQEKEITLESESESESEVENNNLNDYYSDNFSDEEEICEGLENNLEEIDFVDLNEQIPNTSDSDVDSEEPEPDEEPKTENKNSENDDNEYDDKSLDELITEINKLKKLAFEKDKEVSKLKSKYRNLYSELNL